MENNNKTIRICLCGTHSTGKTTILKAFAERHPEFKVITEVVRNLRKTKGINVNELGDKEGQALIFDTYMELLSDKDSNWISDRSIDPIAYSYYHAKTNYDMAAEAKRELERAREWVKNNRDILFFYFPIEFDVIADGFRSTNEDFRKDIDQLMLGVLKELKIPYIEVKGSVEERMRIVEEVIAESVII